MIKNARIKHKVPAQILDMSVGSSGYTFASWTEIASDGSVWIRKDANVYNGIIDHLTFYGEKVLRATRLYKLSILGPTCYKVKRLSQNEYEIDMMNWVDDFHIGRSLDKIDTSKYFKIGQADLKICRRQI